MPVVVKTRSYDEDFYQDMRNDRHNNEAPKSFAETKAITDELF